MNGYIAFVKKEFTENMKNHRFFIMLAVFLAFGMMSALLARFTPEILSALAAEMEMTSEPIALDACVLWIVGFLYLSILIVGCVLFNQTFTSILFTGGIVAVISLLGIIEPLAKFSPFNLTTQNIDLISGIAAPSDFIMPVLTSVVMSILGLLLAVRLFNEKAL